MCQNVSPELILAHLSSPSAPTNPYTQAYRKEFAANPSKMNLEALVQPITDLLLADGFGNAHSHLNRSSIKICLKEFHSTTRYRRKLKVTAKGMELLNPEEAFSKLVQSKNCLWTDLQRTDILIAYIKSLQTKPEA